MIAGLPLALACAMVGPHGGPAQQRGCGHCAGVLACHPVAEHPR